MLTLLQLAIDAALAVAFTAFVLVLLSVLVASGREHLSCRGMFLSVSENPQQPTATPRGAPDDSATAGKL